MLLFRGNKIERFLNMFKLVRDLMAEKRIHFFEHEGAHFAKDAIAYPFVLNSSLDQISRGGIYT